jgi:alkylation response protein AidB-like acyl-CoA dehydrogenase
MEVNESGGIMTATVQSTFDEGAASELLDRTRQLLPSIKEAAEAAERDARMPDDVVRELKKAGLLDVILSKRHGGFGASWTTYQRITYEIARVSPAAGWLHGILGAASFYASKFPQSLRDELFANGKTPLMCGVISLGGVIEPVEGGYLATAKWPFSTGCYHAEWALGGVMVKNADGSMTPGATIVVPASDIKIDDSWRDVTGMRGTGSATVVVDQVFVPEQHVIAPDYQLDRTFQDVPPDADITECWPLWALLVGTNTAVALGAAEGMLDKVCDAAGRRGITYSQYQRISGSQVAQAEIAKAALKIHAARLIMYSSAKELDRAALMRKHIAIDDRARSRGEHGFAVDLLRQAADSLLTVYGTSAFVGSNDQQLFWRDINVITRHGLAASNSGFESYGKSLLGVEPNNILLPYL